MSLRESRPSSGLTPQSGPLRKPVPSIYRTRIRSLVRILSLCAGLCSFILADNSHALVFYWDPNGLNPVTGGVWDTTTSQWSSTSTLSGSPVAWNTSAAAGFCAGTNAVGPITVSVNSAIIFAGFFNGGLAGETNCNLTINGSGSLNLVSGLQAALTIGTNGGSTAINVPVTGPGAFALEASGPLYLNVSNSYSGGTQLGFSTNPAATAYFSGIVYYSNNASFGTGPISMFSSGCALAAEGNSPITITNAFNGTNGQLNISPGPGGTTFSGPWSLGANNMLLGTGITGGSNLTIAGPITSTGNFVAFNAGTLTLTGTNSFSGSISNGCPLVISGAGLLNTTTNTTITNQSTITFSSSGSQTLNASITGPGSLICSGTSVTVENAQTYTGETILSNATYAIDQHGSIGNTSRITISSNSLFDVLQGQNPFSLTTIIRASGVGTNSSTGAAFLFLSPNASLALEPFELIFTPTAFTGDTAHPSLCFVNGPLVLSSNNFTVNNASGFALNAGVYRIIQTDQNIAAAGTFPLTMAGSGLAAGATGSIQVSGKNVNLVVQGPGTFSNLTPNKSATYGANTVALSGIVSAPGPVYPAMGETVSVTVNGNTQMATTSDATGDFSLNYNVSSLPPSGTPYAITYSYGGDGLLLPATNNSTTLTMNRAPLSVTANNVSRPYGQVNPILTGTIVGLTNGDNITATYSCSATTNSPPGTYPVVPTLVDPNGRLANYSATTNNGTLTVDAIQFGGIIAQWTFETSLPSGSNAAGVPKTNIAAEIGYNAIASCSHAGGSV